jgi:phosphate transport system permease protein
MSGDAFQSAHGLRNGVFMDSECVEANAWEAVSAGGRSRCVERTSPRIPRAAWLEPGFVWLTRLSAILVMMLLAGIFVLLLVESMPALREFGPKFLIGSLWNPVTEKFGALAPISGTIVSSLIAMLVGVPLALGVALFINELCPFRLRSALTITVELLAAIPSIIYGM